MLMPNHLSTSFTQILVGREPPPIAPARLWVEHDFVLADKCRDANLLFGRPPPSWSLRLDLDLKTDLDDLGGRHTEIRSR
jgi:hypothetical protein